MRDEPVTEPDSSVSTNNNLLQALLSDDGPASAQWQEPSEQHPEVTENKGELDRDARQKFLTFRQRGAVEDAIDCALTCAKEAHDPLWFLREAAWTAQGAGNYQVAIDICRRLRARWPDEVVGYILGANALSRLGRRSDARALLDEATVRFPGSTEVETELCWVNIAEGSFDAALAQATISSERDRSHKGVHLARIAALLGLNRSEEAFEYAIGLKSIFGNEKWLADQIMRLEKASSRMRLAPTPASSPGVATYLQKLMLNFESLGGSGQGCEFGLVQRFFGVEPLGLLRWTYMPMPQIVDLLTSKFDGVGSDQTTEVVYSKYGGDNPEYVIRDKRFVMETHTFIKKNSSSHDVELKRGRQRLVLLARKLEEDLTEGRKIFVYKLGERNLWPTEIVALQRAISAYGKGYLLYVKTAIDGEVAGTVELVAPRLLIGRISRFSLSPDGGGAREPDYLCWLNICLEANKIANQQD